MAMTVADVKVCNCAISSAPLNPLILRSTRIPCGVNVPDFSMATASCPEATDRTR